MNRGNMGKQMSAPGRRKADKPQAGRMMYMLKGNEALRGMVQPGKPGAMPQGGKPGKPTAMPMKPVRQTGDMPQRGDMGNLSTLRALKARYDMKKGTATDMPKKGDASSTPQRPALSAMGGAPQMGGMGRMLLGMKKGGPVKGSSSARGDGCCMKGKTKGKMY